MNFCEENILLVGASSGIGLASAGLLHGLRAHLHTASRHESAELGALQTHFLPYDAALPVEAAFDVWP